MLAFKGEIAALLAAFLWASASVVYSRLGQQLSPLLLNFLKGAIALVFLLITALITSHSLPSLSQTPLLFLLMSGIIGISIGDTVFFASLKYLGARRALLFETLAPPLAAIIAFFFLQEKLSIYAWVGIILTVAGVAWVISERTSDDNTTSPSLKLGIWFGLGGAIAQAVGAVLSRAVLSDYHFEPLWSSIIRLAVGTVFLIPLLIPFREQLQVSLVKWSWRFVWIIVITSFASTYLAIWLQQISLKFTDAGIAQTLSATSPLFVLPIAAILGETITLRAVLGVMIAIAGIALLFLPG